MAGTNMASKVTKNVCQEPIPATNKLGPSSGLSRKLPAYNSTKLPKANDLDHHRENIQAEGISKRATALIKISKRNNSLKHFESIWGKWVSWCSGRKICPTGCDTNSILDYLAETFDSGFQYNNIGSHRSEILAIHDPVESKKFGDHPGIFTLMAGTFNQRLLQPRHIFTWNGEKYSVYLR